MTAPNPRLQRTRPGRSSRLLGIAFGTVVGVAGFSVVLPGQDLGRRRAMEQYLMRRYDRVVGSFSRDFRASRTEALEFKHVTEPVLAAALRNTAFFVTSIPSKYMEYPGIEALVSAETTNRSVRFRATLSPVFEQIDTEFLEQFVGVSAQSKSERQEVASAIGRLLASITYRGTISEPVVRDETYRVELWHHDLLWRVLVVEFDRTAVSGVTVESRPAYQRKHA